jgi:thiamine-phosphate pyrophosphorylase
MSLDLPLPIIYAITSGTTTARTTPEDQQFSDILRLVEAAVAARVSLLQIREKALTARVLYELTTRAVEIAHGSHTRLLVNDRSDIARTAGADGVHLTTHSLPAPVVRQISSPEFLIGVSTHSRQEAQAAQLAGADFVVFGPVFDTESKRVFGEPQGLEKLQELTTELREIPVLAIGGVTLDNVETCFNAGASGVAAIRLLNDAARLPSIVEVIRSKCRIS